MLFESPSNPMLDIVDIKAVCDLAHKAGAKVVLDNAFATPMLQRPLEWGADIVVHSATKYIDGQGRTLGGAMLGSKEFILDKLQPIIRNTGPSLSPFNAWVLVKGMETLGLRIDRHCANAARVADALAGHPAISRVLYPGRSDHPQHKLAMKQMSGAGGVVTFDLKAGKWAAFETLNRLKLIDISNNLGDAKSLVTHPATTTHMRIGAEERAKLGIGDGTVRISVGLEDVEDIIADLVQALGRLTHGRAMSLARSLWEANTDLAQRILAHGFVRGLARRIAAGRALQGLRGAGRLFPRGLRARLCLLPGLQHGARGHRELRRPDRGRARGTRAAQELCPALAGRARRRHADRGDHRLCRASCWRLRERGNWARRSPP